MADPTLPFDLEAQNQSIQQKRALQVALQQQALTQPQGQMISGRYVAPGIGGLISQLGGALVGKFAGQQADQAQKAYGDNYSKQLSSGLTSYLNQRNGTPGETMTDGQASNLMNNDVAPNLADPTKANPQEAVIRAMASRIPELQTIGKMDFANLLKNNELETKDVNGQLIQYGKNGNGPVRVLGDFRSPMAVNSQLVKQTGEKVGDYRDKFGDVVPVAQPTNGPAIYGQRQPDTGEVKFAPGGSTFSPDKTGNIEALQQAGKVLGTSREQVITARGALTSAENLMRLSQDPEVNTGFGASAVTGVQAIGAKLGFNGPDAPAKTQALISGLAARTLEAGQEMKGSFSDKDVAFLKQVSDGSINLTPQVLQHAAGLAQAAAHNQLLNAFQQHESASTVTGADEISKLYPIPPLSPYKLDATMFPETASGRVRYNSPLLQPTTPKASTATPTVSNWSN